MSQELINALQQKAAADPRIPPGMPPHGLRALLHVSASSAAARKGAPYKPASKPDPVTASKSKHILRLSETLYRNGITEDQLNSILSSAAAIHPAVYLRLTVPGRELLHWLSDVPSANANEVVDTITGRHNNRPSTPSQDIRIMNDPFDAWLALRGPVIERLLQKESFSGLLQKQERILMRLGAIWETCAEYDGSRQVTWFDRTMTEHQKIIKTASSYSQLHSGYLAEVFFRYETLLKFYNNGDGTVLGDRLEALNPALKLHRLLGSAATRNPA